MHTAPSSSDQLARLAYLREPTGTLRAVLVLETDALSAVVIAADESGHPLSGAPEVRIDLDQLLSPAAVRA